MRNKTAPSHLLFIGATTTVAAIVSLSVWRWVSTRSSSSHEIDDDDADYGIDGGADSETMSESLRRVMEKERRRQAKKPMLAMKSPMYDNIKMLDPAGTLLCTISKKKARWYVRKKLGDWVDLKETTLQLRFEPSHRSNESKSAKATNFKGKIEKSDDEAMNGEEETFFNKSIKENICVVCGDDKYHQRHYIVPYACRTLFPSKYKLHVSLIPACVSCIIRFVLIMLLQQNDQNDTDFSSLFRGWYSRWLTIL